jgi:zinc transporter 9
MQALPYYIKVSQSQLQLISTLGGGLLLGSALAVVIPEGFHAFNDVR